MASIEGTPVWVEGSLTAGNIRAGKWLIPASTQDPVGTTDGNQFIWVVTVTVPGMSGSGNIYPQVTPVTMVPAGRTDDGSVRMLTVAEIGESSFQVYMHRSTEVDTWFFWFATRDP